MLELLAQYSPPGAPSIQVATILIRKNIVPRLVYTIRSTYTPALIKAVEEFDEAVLDALHGLWAWPEATFTEIEMPINNDTSTTRHMETASQGDHNIAQNATC